MKKFLLRSIKFYKKHLSSGLRPACRFSPTCSEYAYTAIERYGSIKGSWLSIKRILRCNPLFKAGYDPVPEDSLITIRRT
ncbi:MAG: membrane protein insertion efficiency factor YidD [Eubacteriales bacterium]|nr:membrane protein insertion efficiency factor YidD [Eubacteriales bacterium]